MRRQRSKPANEGILLLEEPINQIIKLVERLPPKYKEMTFEKLLESTIVSNLDGGRSSVQAEYKTEDEFVMPVEVKAFLAQYDFSEDDIHKYFMISRAGKITLKYKIKATRAAHIQIQTACLLALENALHDGRFEFMIDDVKKRCARNAHCSKASLDALFRQKKDLFVQSGVSERLTLTATGKERLADILDELSGKA